MYELMCLSGAGRFLESLLAIRELQACSSVLRSLINVPHVIEWRLEALGKKLIVPDSSEIVAYQMR